MTQSAYKVGDKVQVARGAHKGLQGVIMETQLYYALVKAEIGRETWIAFSDLTTWNPDPSIEC